MTAVPNCLRCGKSYTRTREDEAFTPEPIHFECRAERCAEQHNTGTLRELYGRYAFGSLSINWEAEAARSLYRRALAIAAAKQGVPA